MEQFKSFALDLNELKNIKGGATYSCKCEGTKGQWTGNYKSQAQADRAAAFWCTNGTDGRCTLL
jgi:hypothetical protein